MLTTRIPNITAKSEIVDGRTGMVITLTPQQRIETAKGLFPGYSIIGCEKCGRLDAFSMSTGGSYSDFQYDYVECHICEAVLCTECLLKDQKLAPLLNIGCDDYTCKCDDFVCAGCIMSEPTVFSLEDGVYSYRSHNPSE